MNLDIRTPIGLMFLSIGALLAVYGLLTLSDANVYARSLGTNVNLWWGIAMFAFGAAMFLAARRSAARGETTEGAHLAEDSVEGVLTEEREHALGLERETKSGEHRKQL